MAYIKTLKDNELIGGTDEQDVYPVSSTQAIFRQNPDGSKPDGVKQKLEDTLVDHEDDAKELHRKTEKLVPSITASSSLFEITGNTNTVTFTGSAVIETPGDEPNMVVPIEEMTVKSIVFPVGSSFEPTSSSTPDSTHLSATYEVPNTIGSHTARFDVTYNGVPKHATTSIVATVKQYYGFVGNDVINQGNNAILDNLIDNSAESTPKSATRFTSTIGNNISVTLPTNGTGTKYTYFAIPSNMDINEVIVGSTRYQYPLESSVTVTKSMGGINCTFRLYKSRTDPDSSEPLKLIINPT